MKKKTFLGRCFLALFTLLWVQSDLLYGQFVYRAESDPGTLAAYPVPIGIQELNNGEMLALSAKSALTKYTLLHLDDNGDVVSAVEQVGGYTDLYIQDMLATSDGGYVLSGTAFISGTAHTYLAKYNASDVYQWSVAVDHPNREHEYGTYVEEIGDGYVVTGQVYKPANFPDPEEYYVTLLKVNLAGTFQWARRFENLFNFEGEAVDELSNGNLVVAVDHFTGSSTYTGLSFYITGPFGHFLSNQGFNYGSNYRTVDVKARDGNFLLLGQEKFSTPTNLLLVNLSNSGTVLWAKNYEDVGARDLYALKMQLDGDDILLHGLLDPFGSSPEPFQMKLESNGDLNWAKEYNEVASSAYAGDMCITDYSGSAYISTNTTASNPFKVVKTDYNGYSGCNDTEFAVSVASFSPTFTQFNSSENSVSSATSQTRNWSSLTETTDVTCCNVGATCIIPPLAANSNFHRSLGTDENDTGFSIHLYPSGVFIGGTSDPVSGGDRDQMIMRADDNGTLCHLYLLDQQADEWAMDAILAEQNCGTYVTAGFQDAGNSDFNAIVTTMNGAGTAPGWARVLDEEEWGLAFEVMEMDNGDLVVCGYTSTVTNGGEDMLLARFDANGNQLWSKAIGTSVNDRAYAMAKASDGFVLVGETASGRLTGKEIYVVKTDFNGNPVWSRIMGANEDDLGHDVEIDSDGKIYVAGYVTTDGERDAMLSRLTSGGTVEYINMYRLDADDEAYGLTIHPDLDIVYLAGYSKVYLTSLGQQAYSIVTTKSGGIVKASLYGGAGTESFHGVVVNDEGEALFAGTNTSYSPSATEDVLLVKLDPSYNTCLQLNVTPYGESLEPEAYDNVNDVNTDNWQSLVNIVNCPPERSIDQCSTPEGPAGGGESSAKVGRSLDPGVNSWKVYPNPSSGRIQVTLPEATEQDGLIQVTDLQGRTLRQVRVDARQTQVSIDLQDLGQGIYFLTWESPEGRFIQKIVLNP